MAVFCEAEAIQIERQPEFPRLHSLRGYWYCDLLLNSEKFAEYGLDGLDITSETVEWFQGVLARGNDALRIALDSSRNLLDIALSHLTLGRAYVSLSMMTFQEEDRKVTRSRAAEHLHQAVDGLRQTGQEVYLPYGLLARAAFRRLGSDFTGAVADLSEVLEIAERGPMRLFECDAHLELARLCQDQGQLDEARGHVERARELVEQTGYGRRTREVEYLSRVLGLPT